MDMLRRSAVLLGHRVQNESQCMMSRPTLWRRLGEGSEPSIYYGYCITNTTAASLPLQRVGENPITVIILLII